MRGMDRGLRAAGRNMFRLMRAARGQGQFRAELPRAADTTASPAVIREHGLHVANPRVVSTGPQAGSLGDSQTTEPSPPRE